MARDMVVKIRHQNIQWASSEILQVASFAVNMACYIEDHRWCGAVALAETVERLIQALESDITEAERTVVAVASTRSLWSPVTTSHGPEEMIIFAKKIETMIEEVGGLSSYDLNFLAERQAVANLKQRLDHQKAGLLLFSEHITVRPPAGWLMRSILGTPLANVSPSWEQEGERLHTALCNRKRFYAVGLCAIIRVLEGAVSWAHILAHECGPLGFAPPIPPRTRGRRLEPMGRQYGSVLLPIREASSGEQQEHSASAIGGAEHKIAEGLQLSKLLMECEETSNFPTWRNLLGSRRWTDGHHDGLVRLGAAIVHKLGRWMRSLPFYREIPGDQRVRLIVEKWHVLLIVTTSARSAGGRNRHLMPSGAAAKILVTLQSWLSYMGHPLAVQQIQEEVGPVIEYIARLAASFRSLELDSREFVCLKAMIMLAPDDNPGGRSLRPIYDRCLNSLRGLSDDRARADRLLANLHGIQEAGEQLRGSKGYYLCLPFCIDAISVKILPHD